MQWDHVLLFSTCVAMAACTRPATPGYVETADCEEQQSCRYFYSAQQEYENSGEQQLTKVNATVDITCTSTGLYNNSDAKLLCMMLKNPIIYTSAMENSSAAELSALQQTLSRQLGNWFCFVQLLSGKVPAVYHTVPEPDHVISFKKSIAAAFQANFEGTEEEEETDPQSQHMSHYSYTPTTEEGIMKMHRKIRKSDVTSEELPDDIDTAQDEDIEYRAGRLERSSGNASFHLIQNPDADEDAPITLAQAFAAKGSYEMELKACREVSKNALTALKRRIMSDIKQTSGEESLKAHRDDKKEALEQIKALKEKLPASSALLALQSYDDHDGEKLVPILQSLVELEAEFGVQTSQTPVIDEIMTFMSDMPKSGKVRDIVYMLLSTDGSLRSQMALLRAFEDVGNSQEASVILTHISFMKTVKIGLVIRMEELLTQPSEDSFTAQQLLLVFSNLATKGSDEVEDQVINFLSQKVTTLHLKTDPDLEEMQLLLLALGNTGSKQSISLILSFLDTNSTEQEQINLLIIGALSNNIDDDEVLTRLETFLEDDPSIETIAAIVEALHDGFEYLKKTANDPTKHIKSHSLLYSLAEAVSHTSDTDLHSMMADYLLMIKADNEIFDLVYEESSFSSYRGKRGTTDWDSTSNSDYNYVDSLVSRQSHVSTYQWHRAYINSKTIGVSKANIKVAYGYFAGTSTHCDFKVFGRCTVVGKLLSKSQTLADIKFDAVASNTSASMVTYVKVGSTTLLNRRYQHSNDHCGSFTKPIAQGRIRLFGYRQDIFIYVGYLTLSVDLYAHFNMDVTANMCIGRTNTEVSGALGSLTPTVGVTISGGVTGNLLELARGGISVSATFNYRLEPIVSVQGCTAFCTLSGRQCVGIYDSQPPSSLNLDTWYQIRSVRTCGSGWFRYPCIRWGRRRRVSSLSSSWSFGGQSRRRLWEKCEGYLHPTCAAGVLSSPLFELLTSLPPSIPSLTPPLPTSLLPVSQVPTPQLPTVDAFTADLSSAADITTPKIETADISIADSTTANIPSDDLMTASNVAAAITTAKFKTQDTLITGSPIVKFKDILTTAISAADLTTADTTTADIITAKIKTEDMTTGILTADLTTADITTADVTTEDSTTAIFKTKDMLTTGSPTAQFKDMLTTSILTVDLTTTDSTTAKIKTKDMTTGILTADLTTADITTADSTTAKIKSEDMTTGISTADFTTVKIKTKDILTTGSPTADILTTTAFPPQQSWPYGTYSFPKASSGCPSGFSSGCVYQDNEDSNANKFTNTHLVDGSFGRNIRICYCTRPFNSGSGSWPPGQYCIAKKGSCPSGFRYGSIYWDDEDSRNDNSRTGVIPDGSYSHNTRIEYCCRSDGSRNSPIRLPTSVSFILYQYRSRGCQRVLGMVSREITIYFDDEDSGNTNSCSGYHPYNTGCAGRNHHLYLCHYSY